VPEGTTTVRLADGTADELHDLKDRGESYDDVVQQLLAEHYDRGNDEIEAAD